MNKLRILGIIRHLVGIGSAVGLGTELASPETVDAITHGADAAIDVVATATPSFSELVYSVGIIIAFIWSYFSPEKQA